MCILDVYNMFLMCYVLNFVLGKGGTENKYRMAQIRLTFGEMLVCLC